MPCLWAEFRSMHGVADMVPLVIWGHRRNLLHQHGNLNNYFSALCSYNPVSFSPPNEMGNRNWPGGCIFGITLDLLIPKHVLVTYRQVPFEGIASHVVFTILK